MKATPGMPFRQAVARRQERVRHIMHTLPPSAQAAIQESLDETSGNGGDYDYAYSQEDTQVLPAYRGEGYENTTHGQG
jgi:phospholipid/cholesterol/gamma-HCH transport system ATP-binding protein